MISQFRLKTDEAVFFKFSGRGICSFLKRLNFRAPSYIYSQNKQVLYQVGVLHLPQRVPVPGPVVRSVRSIAGCSSWRPWASSASSWRHQWRHRSTSHGHVTSSSPGRCLSAVNNKQTYNVRLQRRLGQLPCLEPHGHSTHNINVKWTFISV